MSAPPFNTTAGFVARFVEPLLGGGTVEVEAPLSSHDRAQMLEDASWLLDADLLHLRTRVAQQLVADPVLPEPNADELSLWLGLHDVLALDHPDTERVWTRDSTWRKVETETRSLLAFARPVDMSDALVRHLAVGAFLQLRREDHLVVGPDGEHRFRGQQPPRRRFGLFSPSFADIRTELVRWIDQPHAAVVDRLLPDVMWVSPLTSLLRPGWAPPGWSPLMSVDFLRSRPFARAVCHAWAREREWLRIGGVVAGSLLRSLNLHAEVFGEQQSAIPGTAAAMQRAAKHVTVDEELDEPDEQPDERPSGALAALPEPPLTRAPEDIGAVVGALIHLHTLKVLEYDARISIGLGARDWAVQSFLSLPLLLPALERTLGRPFFLGPERGAGPDALAGAEEAFARRWEEYCEHLAGLVPRPIVEKLLATLVRRIVEPLERRSAADFSWTPPRG
ncbi:MAG: hypothetical protein R6X02_07130 [Enhygromyxa sp.]